MTNQEKRQSERVPLSLKVDCQFEGNFLYEYASDISQHGIFIETKEPLAVDTVVNLQFTLPDSEQHVEVSGVVKWVNSTTDDSGGESKNPGMGIQFTRIRDIDKETITTLVRRLAVL